MTFMMMTIRCNVAANASNSHNWEMVFCTNEPQIWEQEQATPCARHRLIIRSGVFVLCAVRTTVPGYGKVDGWPEQIISSYRNISVRGVRTVPLANSRSAAICCVSVTGEFSKIFIRHKNGSNIQ